MVGLQLLWRFGLFLMAVFAHHRLADEKRTILPQAQLFLLLLYDGMLVFIARPGVEGFWWKVGLIGFFLAAGVVIVRDLFLVPRCYYSKGMRLSHDVMTYDAVAQDFYRVLREAGRPPSDLVFWPGGEIDLRDPDDALERAVGEVLLEVPASKEARRRFRIVMLGLLVFPALVWLVPLLQYAYSLS